MGYAKVTMWTNNKKTVTEAYAQDQKILSVQSSALMKAKEPQLIGMSQSIWP